MVIGKALLDDLYAQAKASPRLRMNLDLRNSADDGSLFWLDAGEEVKPVHLHRSSSELVVK